MSTCCVTGGAGFIGSHLVDKLISLGHKVIVIDNLSTGHTSNIKKCDGIIVKDINDNLDDIFNKYQFDYVFHLAAFINLRESIKNPKECFKVNVLGSINVIDCCVKYDVKKIIFSSTGGAIYYPLAELPWNENSLAEPASPYGLSKLNIEQYLRITKNIYNLDYSVLRYSNVYGPRQDALGEAGVISIFIKQIMNKESLKIFGTGEQTRDFVYVDDVVNANIIAIKLENDVYNISTNKSHSINELVDLLDKSAKINYLPAIPGEVMRTQLSYDKILKASGWTPQTNIVDGIEKTTEYFKDK